jgi:predicted GNAT superfamily acetyltransferase
MSEVVEIRSCHALEEFHACVELQREIWGEADREVEPATMFVMAAHTGGQVIGAYASNVLVGFILAVAGVRERTPYLHSHMAGVRVGYRDQGLGRKLKLFQRDEALQRGIGLIEWTFDPLEVRNAHFNFNRLGAISRRYLPNLYGVTTSPLHRGLRTDRLLAEWHLEDPAVIAKIASASGAATTHSPEKKGFALKGVDSRRISVPASMPYGVDGDISGATALQDRLRAEFIKTFEDGFVAVATDESPAYIFTRADRVRP